MKVEEGVFRTEISLSELLVKGVAWSHETATTIFA
jgi:hypothetical protein